MKKNIEIIDKSSWLRDVDVYRQIETCLNTKKYNNVDVFDVVSNAEKFNDTISQALDKKHRNKAFTRYIVPYAKNSNHFVNIIIDLKDQNCTQVLYFDPKGHPIPEDLEATIISMFEQVNLRVLTAEQQTNCEDCGVYTPLNAEIFANTDLDFDYFERHQHILFPHLDEAQIIERRKQIVQVLNEHYDDSYYYRDHKPSAAMLSSEIDALDAEAKEYKADINQQFWDLIKQNLEQEFDPEKFASAFDTAAECYQEHAQRKENAKLFGKSSDYNNWMGLFKNKHDKLCEQISELAPKPSK